MTYGLMGNFGQERRQSAEEGARRIVSETLAVVRLTPAQLQMVPANAALKVQLARRLRRQTPLSLKWIAQQLGVGSWKYLSNLLGQETADPTQPELRLETRHELDAIWQHGEPTPLRSRSSKSPPAFTWARPGALASAHRAS
jgi:hypothetical protein